MEAAFPRQGDTFEKTAPCGGTHSELLVAETQPLPLAARREADDVTIPAWRRGRRKHQAVAVHRSPRRRFREPRWLRAVQNDVGLLVSVLATKSDPEFGPDERACSVGPDDDAGAEPLGRRFDDPRVIFATKRANSVRMHMRAVRCRRRGQAQLDLRMVQRQEGMGPERERGLDPAL